MGRELNIKLRVQQRRGFPVPANSLDAAVLANFNPNSYTALIPTATSGIVLAEIYDADTAEVPTGRLVNVSGRAQVGVGNGVLIVGFVIKGNTSEQILVRAIGPELNTMFGITGVLADPQLDLYSGTTLVQHNDDWGGGTAFVNAFNEVGAFPLTSQKDAAMVVTLLPGAYTVVVSGVGNTSGIGLVELYDMQ